jgi:hypothetical protein
VALYGLTSGTFIVAGVVIVTGATARLPVRFGVAEVDLVGRQ